MKLLILAAIVCYAYGAAVPSEERCARCHYTNGVGYLPYEDNCHQYIQCQKLPHGTYIEHVMNCGHLVWSQEILTCMPSKDAGATCIDGPIIREDSEEEGSGESVEIIKEEQEVEEVEVQEGEEQNIEQELKGQELVEEETIEKESVEVIVEEVKPACDKSEGPSKTQYIWTVHGHGFTMYCAPGTVFSTSACGCVAGGAANKRECKREPMLHFDFNENFDDVSCNHAAGTTYGHMTIVDGAAHFDGDSRIEIGFLKNFFKNNNPSGLTLTMWFKSEGDGRLEGLFSNGDCVEEASLSLSVEDSKLQGLLNTYDKRITMDGEKMKIQKDEWTFVAMVKSGWDVKYYINDKQVGQETTFRNIKNTQCAASIGFSGADDGANFFHGSIDDVRVYKKTLYDYDLGQLFKNGRQ